MMSKLLLDTRGEDEDEAEAEIEDGSGPFYHPIAKPRSPSKPEDGLGRYNSVAASPDYSGSMHSSACRAPAGW